MDRFAISVSRVNMLTRDKNDNKSFYLYVRSKSKTKDVVGPLKDVDGLIITDDLTMSNIFKISLFRQCSQRKTQRRRKWL